MQITVHGQTIESFKITVEDATKQSQIFDIQSALVIEEGDLDREIADCAAREHFWAQIALEAETELEDFEKTWYSTYCAHTEKYARYYLRAQGDKSPTGVAKEKCAALLYSESADRRSSAYVAYQAYTDEMEKVGVTALSEDDFREEMYKYEETGERIERIRLSLAHRAKQMKAVSAAFNTKSWSIKTLAADKRARLGANI